MTKTMFQIVVDSRLCKGCGICATFCPGKVFEQDEDGKPVLAHREACVGCKMCELRCPDFAIRLIGGK
ncbi:MAG: 4Fe-4S binding protein [Megasphaera sp.]|jgi:2-oxoglutarate ferredoxin oxidoreductase subunit delta|nr:4Fe-4S binding protein [Megasphaera sp.]MCH4188566.1 4Fe-4S binding protein [Megasphaera sp.]MCH4218453.1 4Fe-4S binding protein [Megasphaera sp.]